MTTERGGRTMQLVATRCNSKARIESVSKIVSAIETDLMMTSDFQLVVGHPSVYQAEDLTLTEVQKMDIDGEHPMNFEELVSIIKDKELQIFLDLKSQEMGALVAKEVLKFSLSRRSVMISWGQENLVNIRRAVTSHLRTGWIVNGALSDPVSDVSKLGCDYFVTCPYYLTEEFLRKLDFLHRLCLRDCHLTSEQDFLRMKEFGASFLFVKDELFHLEVLQKMLQHIS